MEGGGSGPGAGKKAAGRLSATCWARGGDFNLTKKEGPCLPGGGGPVAGGEEAEAGEGTGGRSGRGGAWRQSHGWDRKTHRAKRGTWGGGGQTWMGQFAVRMFS